LRDGAAISAISICSSRVRSSSRRICSSAALTEDWLRSVLKTAAFFASAAQEFAAKSEAHSHSAEVSLTSTNFR
jgi:hypothetical protein